MQLPLLGRANTRIIHILPFLPDSQPERNPDTPNQDEAQNPLQSPLLVTDGNTDAADGGTTNGAMDGHAGGPVDGMENGAVDGQEGCDADGFEDCAEDGGAAGATADVPANAAAAP